MATDITNHLATIINARYGEQVRQAIHDAIKACYTDGNWDASTGMVDLLAREAINSILDRSTGNVQETRIWPSSDVDIYDTDWEGAWYNGQDLTFDYELTPGVKGTNPNADFDYIYVYYKPVITASPELHIFKASTNYGEGFGSATVVGGTYFGYDDEEQDTGAFATMRKINIYTNPNSDSSLDFQLGSVRGWRIYSDNGTLRQSITDVESTSSSHAGGTIFQITGVKYASIEDAVTGALSLMSFAEVENGTLKIGGNS